MRFKTKLKEGDKVRLLRLEEIYEVDKPLLTGSWRDITKERFTELCEPWYKAHHQKNSTKIWTIIRLLEHYETKGPGATIRHRDTQVNYTARYLKKIK